MLPEKGFEVWIAVSCRKIADSQKSHVMVVAEILQPERAMESDGAHLSELVEVVSATRPTPVSSTLAHEEGRMVTQGTNRGVIRTLQVSQQLVVDSDDLSQPIVLQLIEVSGDGIRVRVQDGQVLSLKVEPMTPLRRCFQPQTPRPV